MVGHGAATFQDSTVDHGFDDLCKGTEFVWVTDGAGGPVDWSVVDDSGQGSSDGGEGLIVEGLVEGVHDPVEPGAEVRLVVDGEGRVRGHV